MGQSSDLARVEQTYIPQSKSENRVNRFRAFVRFPLKRNDSSYFIPGVEYRKIGLDINDEVPFSIDNLKEFQVFRVSLAYTFKIKNDWRIVADGGIEIASNFERRQILNHDLRLQGSLFFIRDRKGDETTKPDRLVLGLNYSTNAGRPFPIPLVNYHRKFRPNWSYSVGIPKTNLKHNFTDKQAIQAYLTIDGFFSNLQNNLVVNQNNSQLIADNISMTTVLGGLGYEYFFTKNLLFYTYGGYSIFNEIRLRDTSRNNLYTLNDENTFYLRGGIKFKI